MFDVSSMKASAKATPIEFAMAMATIGLAYKTYQWVAASTMKQMVPIHTYLEMKGSTEPTVDALEIEMCHATVKYKMALEAQQQETAK